MQVALPITSLIAQAIRVQKVNVLNTLLIKEIVQPIKETLTNMRKFLQNCYFSIGSYILSKGVSILDKMPFFKKRVSYMVKQTIVAIIFDSIVLLLTTIIFIRVTNLIVSNNIVSQYAEYVILSFMSIYFILAMVVLWKRMDRYKLS